MENVCVRSKIISCEYYGEFWTFWTFAELAEEFDDKVIDNSIELRKFIKQKGLQKLTSTKDNWILCKENCT